MVMDTHGNRSHRLDVHLLIVLREIVNLDYSPLTVSTSRAGGCNPQRNEHAGEEAAAAAEQGDAPRTTPRHAGRLATRGGGHPAILGAFRECVRLLIEVLPLLYRPRFDAR